MQMLYDSDSFVVVVIPDANADPDDQLAPMFKKLFGEKPRTVFEIVDKRNNNELCLHDEWADAFQHQIKAWQEKMPTQEEVEEILEAWATLAVMPLMMH